MPVRTFDPGKFIITIAGLPINGFADGTYINIERETDTFSKEIGADGVVSRVAMNDKSALLTITLSQTSPSNDALSILHNADELTGQGVVPIAVKDITGRSTYISGSGWIKKPAGFEGSKELTTREWVIDMAETIWFTGGNGEI